MGPILLENINTTREFSMHPQYLPWSQEIYVSAYQFAARAHVGQNVPGTDISYIQHLSFVSMEVIAALREDTHKRDENLAIQCALLHDVVEDTKVTQHEVETRFGSAVAQGVQALTKDKTRPKAEQMDDSLARIVQQPHEIWMVKLADRISNLLPPPAHWDQTKRRYYHQEAQLILKTLGPASPSLSKRLQERINAYTAFFE